MARSIEWVIDTQKTGDGEIIDAIGMLGPLKAFTLFQVCSPKGFIQEWNLTSHFIPTKRRNASFRSIDDGKAACEEIIGNFAVWLAG